MIIKKIDKWNYVSQMENLLFFANLIDEMTFNYTLDSFKASVHNIFSLMRECLITIKDIQTETIKKGALQPIIEEIKDTLTKDFIIQNVSKASRLNLLEPKINSNTSYDDLKIVMEMFLSQFIIDQYNGDLKKEIANEIKSSKPSKIKIEKLARLFVSQMKFMGYPNASIYKKNIDFFFGQNTNIQSIDDIDTYLSLFDFKEQEYTVCLFGNHLYASIKTSLQSVNIDINDSFKPSQWDTSFSKFDSLKKNEQYIILSNIQALDEYHAMENAISTLVHYTSLFTFFHHKEKFLFVKGEFLVKRDKDGTCFQIKKPMPHILACEDERPLNAAVLFQNSIGSLQMSRNSFYRFVKSIRLHDTAILSDHVENQFLNLFTAFEVLIPKAANSGKDRIIQITDILLPYLCHRHFLKLAESFGRDFRLWKNSLYSSVLAQITEGTTEAEKLCALISLAKYQSLRDQIFTEATNDKFFLLRFRLYKLNDRMGSIHNVKLTYNKFLSKMRWHITRLYRTRNLIVHAGAHPYYLDLLLENIHSFYDTFMRELISDISKSGMKKLEFSYTLRQSRHSSYLNYLNSLNNNAVLDENNFIDVLGLN